MPLPIKYTKAAILVEQNRKLVVDEVQLPTELGIGQVLVELHVSGICGSQIERSKALREKIDFCHIS